MRPIDADALIEFCAERWIQLNVDAVNMQPTIQPENAQHSQESTTSDLISRQAAIDAAEKIIERDTSGNNAVVNAMIAWSEYIRALPPAQHERKRGKWLADNRPGGGFWVCSCCKFPSEAFAADVLYKFCPNCGADMRGEQDDSI